MTTYGLTPTGFVAATVEDIKAEIESDELALIDPLLDLDPDQHIGQINGIVASKIAEMWELLSTAFHAFDDTAAEDSLLDSLSALTGTLRPQDTKGVVTLLCTLAAGTVLPPTARVAKAGDASNLWQIRESFTAPGTGVWNVVFESTRFGNVPATAATLTVIVTPVSGWSAVTNINDATVGRIRALDPELRILRRAELPAQGGSSVPALRAALLQVPGVIEAKVYENATNAINEGGIPPHSLRSVIWDGVAPAAVNQDLFNTIFENTAGGIQSVGFTEGTVVDEFGETHQSAFTRALQYRISIGMSLDVNTDASEGSVFPIDGVAQIKAIIVAKQSEYGIDDDVIRLKIMNACFEVAGVKDVLTCTLNTQYTSPATSNILISGGGVATFDTARIVITT